MTAPRPDAPLPNSPERHSGFSLGKLSFAALWIAISGGIGATAVGFAGAWWWVFDLASHFRAHWFALLSCCSLLLALRGRFRPALFAGGAAAVNLALIAPLYWSAATPPTQGGATRLLRLVAANVLTGNRDYRRTRDFIDASGADFVFLMEIDPAWHAALQDLQHKFPYFKFVPRNDNFGVAMLSRWPVEAFEVREQGEAATPAILARLRVDEIPFTLLGVHTLPPVGAHRTSVRNKQLELASQWVQSEQQPVLLVGDLNATSWSAGFASLNFLHDSRRGFGLQPTWNARHPWCMIPIDHCLVSESVRVVDRKVGPDVGSDHRPIVVDFRVLSP